MKLNIRELLEYFDTKDSTDYGDTTATIAVVGEDLGASLFKHYCENERNSDVEIIDANEEIPTGGKKKGKRLDRWILEKTGTNQTLYQTEIKSWCSRAIGGVTIPIDISKDELLKLTMRNWNRDVSLLNEENINGLNKVLVDMPTDSRLERLGIKKPYDKEPLLILWDARSSDGSLFCFSRYYTKEKHFDYNYCWVFSCSLYLRQMHDKGLKDLHVEVPNAERRIKDLTRIFKI